MHEAEEHMSQQHVHVRSQSSATSSSGGGGSSKSSNGSSNGGSGGSTSTRMACEKASRRLRATLLKATRLGVTTSELAGLPAAKKIVSQRDHDWKLAVLLLLMFGGGVIVALVCTTSRGCTKIEDINLAT